MKIYFKTLSFVFFVNLFLLITLSHFSLQAKGELTKGTPTFPGETCQTVPLDRWTPQEKWVWKQLCEGEIADFNKMGGYGGELDPEKPEEWPDSRILTPVFLETILLHEPYRGALTHYGVRIKGAWFREPLDLSNAILDHQLWLLASRFDKDVVLVSLKTDYMIFLKNSKFNGLLYMTFMELGSGLFMDGAEFKEVYLGGARIRGQIDMTGSEFNSLLNMNSMEVGGSLIMRGGAEFEEVNLGGAKIGGQIDMTGSKFTDKLNMDSMEVGGSLIMRGGAEFEEVDLGSAKIGGQIDMTDSKFTGKLNMDSMEVGGSLFMRGGAEFEEVNLGGARIGGQIGMTGSKFTDKLNMNSMEVGGSLFMRGGAEFKEVDLGGARIGGQIDMIDSKFTGKLNMNSMEVGGSLIMRGGAEFEEVDLGGARIGGQIGMTGSKFTDKLNMNSMEVGGSLFMRGGAEFVEVDLRGTKIGGQIDMTDSKFNSLLNMNSMEVGSNLIMGGGAEFKEVDLGGARIGGFISLSGSTFNSIDLTEANVHEGFILFSSNNGATKWKDKSSMILRNTKICTLQDSSYSWPENLVLEGFVYDRLGKFYNDEGKETETRDIAWLKEWLNKQEKYSSQPYEHLAGVLRKTGHESMSDDILYASMERKRKEATGMYWFGLTLLRISIGYGYGYRILFRPLFWVIFFGAIGTLFIRFGKKNKEMKSLDCIFYSLDLLLPIIRLDERHYKIELEGPARYYFYFHIMMGFFLASFVVAGISGLVQ